MQLTVTFFQLLPLSPLLLLLLPLQTHELSPKKSHKPPPLIHTLLLFQLSNSVRDLSIFLCITNVCHSDDSHQDFLKNSIPVLSTLFYLCHILSRAKAMTPQTGTTQPTVLTPPHATQHLQACVAFLLLFCSSLQHWGQLYQRLDFASRVLNQQPKCSFTPGQICWAVSSPTPFQSYRCRACLSASCWGTASP